MGTFKTFFNQFNKKQTNADNLLRLCVLLLKNWSLLTETQQVHRLLCAEHSQLLQLFQELADKAPKFGNLFWMQ